MKSTNAVLLEGVRINHCYVEARKGPSEVGFWRGTNKQKLMEICSLYLTDLQLNYMSLYKGEIYKSEMKTIP